jgi:hypothetical protein
MLTEADLAKLEAAAPAAPVGAHGIVNPL